MHLPSILCYNVPFILPYRLLSLGYKASDIAEAALETCENRRQLAISLQNKKWDSFTAIQDKVNRKLKKLLLASSPPHSSQPP